MKLSLARKFRFSWIGKLLFNFKPTDYLLRRIFLNKFTENYYENTTINWSLINNKLNSILKKYNGFLGHGAALNLIRNNKISFNQDLDYDIFPLKNENDFFNEINNLGFKLIQKTYLNNILTMFIIEFDGCYIDFFVINKDEQNRNYIATTSYEFNKNYFQKIDNNWFKTNKTLIYKRILPDVEIEERKINNQVLYLPKNYNDYFNYIYGYDWKIPKRYYNWKLEPKNNKVIKIKNNITMLVNKEYLDKLFN